LRDHENAFHYPRYSTLLFRYRARNFPETLNADENRRWQSFRRQRLTRSTSITSPTLDDYFAQTAALRANPATNGAQQALLDQLEQWGHHVARDIDYTLASP
jgi:exodeoxyribonuclease-1